MSLPRNILILSFALLAIAACAPRVVQTRADSVVVEREIYRYDTTYRIAPDSAAMRMLLECDSTNAVVLRALEHSEGERIRMGAELQRTERGGYALNVTSREDSLLVEVERLREIINSRKSSTEVQVVRERYVPRFYIVTAVMFYSLVVIGLVVGGLKIYKKMTII